MDRGTGSAIKRFYRVSYRFTTGKAIESPCPVINKQDCLHGDEVFGHGPLQGHFEQLHALNRKGANRSSDHSIYSPQLHRPAHRQRCYYRTRSSTVRYNNQEEDSDVLLWRKEFTLFECAHEFGHVGGGHRRMTNLAKEGSHLLSINEFPLSAT